MKLWALLTSLSLASLVAADSITLSDAERSGLPVLWIREIRKVSRERVEAVPLRDYAFRDHDTKVVLDDHDHIPGVAQWKLAFLSSGEEVISTLEIEENIASDQKELVFETALVDGASSVFITARGTDDLVLAVGSSRIQIPALESSLAWVGRKYDSSFSSLRIDPGIMSQVTVGRHVCRQRQGPCYILMEELPEIVPRCKSVTEELTAMTVDVCDDTMIPYRELPKPRDIEITKDLTLHLTVPLPQDVVVETLEIVAYNPKDPSVVYSPDSLKCGGSEPELYPGKRCAQNLSMSKKQDLVSILVVAFFGSVNGSLPYSSLVTYTINPQQQVSTGVIVGSVIGGLAAVALIIGLVFFIRKNKSKKSKKSSVKTSAHYTAAPTKEPTEI